MKRSPSRRSRARVCSSSVWDSRRSADRSGGATRPSTGRLGVLFQGDEDIGFFGVDGAWLPSTNNISPYFGVGLGVVGPDCDHCDDGAVVGTKLEVGVEFFRLHGARLMVGVHAVIPFESRRGIDTFNPGIHVRVGF